MLQVQGHAPNAFRMLLHCPYALLLCSRVTSEGAKARIQTPPPPPWLTCAGNATHCHCLALLGLQDQSLSSTTLSMVHELTLPGCMHARSCASTIPDPLACTRMIPSIGALNCCNVQLSGSVKGALSCVRQDTWQARHRASRGSGHFGCVTTAVVRLLAPDIDSVYCV